MPLTATRARPGWMLALRTGLQPCLAGRHPGRECSPVVMASRPKSSIWSPRSRACCEPRKTGAASSSADQGQPGGQRGQPLRRAAGPGPAPVPPLRRPARRTAAGRWPGRCGPAPCPATPWLLAGARPLVVEDDGALQFPGCLAPVAGSRRARCRPWSRWWPARGRTPRRRSPPGRRGSRSSRAACASPTAWRAASGVAEPGQRRGRAQGAGWRRPGPARRTAGRRRPGRGCRCTGRAST